MIVSQGVFICIWYLLLQWFPKKVIFCYFFIELFMSYDFTLTSLKGNTKYTGVFFWMINGIDKKIAKGVIFENLGSPPHPCLQLAF